MPPWLGRRATRRCHPHVRGRLPIGPGPSRAGAAAGRPTPATGPAPGPATGRAARAAASAPQVQQRTARRAEARAASASRQRLARAARLRHQEAQRSARHRGPGPAPGAGPAGPGPPAALSAGRFSFRTNLPIYGHGFNTDRERSRRPGRPVHGIVLGSPVAESADPRPVPALDPRRPGEDESLSSAFRDQLDDPGLVLSDRYIGPDRRASGPLRRVSTGRRSGPAGPS